MLEQNALIVNTGDRLVLFDTGMGSAKDFGPTTGKLQASMKQAGIDPKDIDAVVMSHGHIDHLGGNVGDDGKSNFPNAQFYIQQSDLEFWTDETKTGDLKSFLAQARKNLLPVRDRIVFFKDGQEFLPGITAIGAPGHTVGHTIFNIQSGGKSMAYIGDLTHHPVLLMEKPLTEFAYDTDPKQSAQTRVRLLTMLAANKTPIVAYHFAWPGFGHGAKRGRPPPPNPEEKNITTIKILFTPTPPPPPPGGGGGVLGRGVGPGQPRPRETEAPLPFAVPASSSAAPVARAARVSSRRRRGA